MVAGLVVELQKRQAPRLAPEDPYDGGGLRRRASERIIELVRCCPVGRGNSMDAMLYAQGDTFAHNAPSLERY